MSAAVTLLATAAATVGAVRLVRIVQNRLVSSKRRAAALRRRQDARREGLVLDLEPGADGVFGVRPPAAVGGEAGDDLSAG